MDTDISRQLIALYPLTLSLLTTYGGVISPNLVMAGHLLSSLPSSILMERQLGPKFRRLLALLHDTYFYQPVYQPVRTCSVSTTGHLTRDSRN